MHGLRGPSEIPINIQKFSTPVRWVQNGEKYTEIEY